MQFQEIIGQQKVKDKLIQTVKDRRISHAQLFLGPEGCGHLPMAFAYAKYICCLNKQEEDSCATCSSCLKFNKLIHPDLHFVYPVNSGRKTLKDPVSTDYIAEWREFFLKNPYMRETQWYEYIGIENKQGFIGKNESRDILKKLHFKSFESDYKILIIWLPEKMNQIAANKLLKMVEEPPENTIFLLVSENIESILPTILSRTQIVKFSRIDDNDLGRSLQEKYQLNNDQVDNLVHLANGNYQNALDIINSNDEDAFFMEKFAEFMRFSYKNSIPQIVRFVDEIYKTGREKQKQFLEYSLKMIRENFILNFKHKAIVYMTSEQKKFSEKFHLFVNNKNIFEIYKLLNTASRDIEANAYAKLVFLDICLKLHKLLRY